MKKILCLLSLLLLLPEFSFAANTNSLSITLNYNAIAAKNLDKVRLGEINILPSAGCDAKLNGPSTLSVTAKNMSASTKMLFSTDKCPPNIPINISGNVYMTNSGGTEQQIAKIQANCLPVKHCKDYPSVCVETCILQLNDKSISNTSPSNPPVGITPDGESFIMIVSVPKVLGKP